MSLLRDVAGLAAAAAVFQTIICRGSPLDYDHGSSSSSSGSGGGGGSEWGALCRGKDQSPIDIEPIDVKSSDTQVRLRYKPWHLDDVEAASSQDDFVARVVFKEGHSPGYVQVGTDYNDFDEYALTAVEVHSPSEHTFRHASWPIELQLWHTPMSLLRISRLADDVAGLANRSHRADAHLAAVEDFDQQLRREISGQASPWARAGPVSGEKADRVQTLDWIDATKRRAVAEAARLSAEARAHLKEAGAISSDIRRMVRAQGRKYASHQMVISLLILRSPRYAEPGLADAAQRDATPGSQLVRWASAALAPGRDRGAAGEGPLALDAEAVLAAAPGHELYSYLGSLTRPPCTPNVRWFVTAQPLAALREDIEQLLLAIHSRGHAVGRAKDDPAIIGNGRDIQPIGAGRRLHRVALAGQPFAPPALPLPEMASQGVQKWSFVQRYGKVFLMCAFLLLLSPLLFWLVKKIPTELLDEETEESQDEEGPVAGKRTSFRRGQTHHG